MTIESDKYCRCLTKKRKLESKRKKLADAEYEFPAKTFKKLLFLILYTYPAIVSSTLTSIIFYYSVDNITSLVIMSVLLAFINGLFVFKKREKHLMWTINKLEKRFKENWTKEEIENGLKDYKIIGAILSIPVVGIIIEVVIPTIVSIGFLLPIVLTIAMFNFAKKEKHTLKSFFQVLHSMNPIKLKKKLVKTDLAIKNINKELKNLYEIIKDSPEVLNYLKNSSLEKEGESILYEKLKRDMKLKYEDEVFQFHLNKIGKTEIVNE
tara:strand:+ start:11997 stop:12794 length:798 start_codon:yes stop_codon:yes gene_type:complete